MRAAPQTMTDIGLRFLRALAMQAQGGVFLEIGPLFGSSTIAIAKGRRIDAPIHTIDTFAAAPWVHRRFGFDLDRRLFDKFTRRVENLIVHQGFAPDVVRETWADSIGFYFDDATHGDPGWRANYDFFSPFFRPDAIICGDDFAGGWPDVVRNVTQIAAAGGMQVFVMGRVWAMTAQDDARILSAIDRVCPRLAGIGIEADHGAGPNRLPAAVWSQGLHGNRPLQAARIAAQGRFRGTIITRRGGIKRQIAPLGTEPVRFDGIDQIEWRTPHPVAIQYCLIGENGQTENSKSLSSRQRFDIPPGARIAAVRLSE